MTEPDPDFEQYKQMVDHSTDFLPLALLYALFDWLSRLFKKKKQP